MALARQQDIGPVYDLLLATRDGSTLPCKNKDGTTLNLSQLAFMTSIDRQQQQHEETELQHKDSLIQLASSNLIDREFDQWPQVTQGDWSGGALQRVLSGSTPVTSFTPVSDPSRYWDGEGLLWPIFDYLPQQGFLGPGQTTGLTPVSLTTYGTVGGWVMIGGVIAEPGYGMSFQESGHQHIFWFYADSIASITDPFGVGIIADALATGGGVLWALARPDATHAKIYRIDGLNPTTLQVETNLDTGLSINTNLFSAFMDARQVGNHFYVAAGVTYAHTTLGMKSALVIQDWSNPGGPTAAITIDLPNAFSTDAGGSIVTDLKIAGDLIYVGLSDGSTSNKNWDSGQLQTGAGSRAYVLAYNIAANNWTTAAVIEDASGVQFAPVGGSLFVLAYMSESANTTLSVDMYLLQGSSLQHIGPVTFPTSNWISCSRVAVWGPYAIFGLSKFDSTDRSYHIFAYDVLRGRFFRIQSRGVTGTGPIGHSLATFGSQKRTNAAYTNGIFAQFGIAYDTSAMIPGTLSAELYFGIVPTTSFGGVQVIPPPIQQGVILTSSIIDFTSAQPKLFRQVVATFSSLFADPSVAVNLSVWLDQDPASLSPVPNFNIRITGATRAGATRLSLIINKVATKLVYQIQTTGGGFPTNNVPAPAPKLVSVIAQAATGWTRTMMLDLADNVVVNGKNAMCWDAQSQPGSPAVDATAAYNFLRQLWRLKGGEVTATFPNGDAAADWLLQDMHFDSPKPFGASYRADQKSSLGYLCTLKMREDI